MKQLIPTLFVSLSMIASGCSDSNDGDSSRATSPATFTPPQAMEPVVAEPQQPDINKEPIEIADTDPDEPPKPEESPVPEPQIIHPFSQKPQILPELTNWVSDRGTLQLKASSRVVIDQASADADLNGRTSRQEATKLVADLAALGLKLSVSTTIERNAADILLKVDPTLPKDAYRLKIGDNVSIEASSASGLFYGGRSILQALKQSRELPRGQVLDQPGQGMRGGMIDAGRKYWSPAYLKNLIRNMSYLKLNMLNLHLVESEGFRLNSPKFPGLADPNNSYSKSEIQDLVAFANEHHVDIIPGFEFPGHATVISDYFKIGFGTGENACTAANMHSHLTPDWVLDMTLPKTQEVSANILNEFLPWFTSKFVHLGGDELPGQLANCGKIRTFLANDPDVTTTGDMLVRYLNDLSTVATSNGKRSIIYSGFENMPLSQQSLNKRIVIQDWEGDGTKPAFADHDKIWMNSHYAYVTPNYYHNLSENRQYLTEQWQPSTAKDVLGSSFAVWADYNMWAQDDFFEQHIVGLRSAIAERSWNASTKSTVANLNSQIVAIGNAPAITVSPVPPAIGSSKPKHHYAFEPSPYPSGYTWAGSTGQTLFVKDDTARLHGSTYIIYNPTFSSSGIKGSALSFTADRQGVGLGGVNLPAPWTLSFWIKQTSNVANATLLSSRDGAAILLRDTATGGIAIKTPENVTAYKASIPNNTWLAVSLVNSGKSTSLYIDGRFSETVDVSSPLPLAAIGAFNKSFRGLLDELSIYDAELTADQILTNYKAIAGNQ